MLRAELGKLRATRMTYGLLAAALALVVLSALAIVLSSRTGDGPAALDSVQGTRLIVSTAGAGAVFALILGILAIAGEFRHGTATWTFLATPRRDRVLAAKLAAALVAGIGYGLACLAVLLAVAVPLLATVDGARQPRPAEVATIGAGVVASYALSAMFGVAVGAVLRNQVAAIVVMLAWSFVVESLVLLLVPAVGRWLPGNAASALTDQDAGQLSGYEVLPPWGGGLVLLAYIAVLAALGGWLLARRDVTWRPLPHPASRHPRPRPTGQRLDWFKESREGVRVDMDAVGRLRRAGLRVTRPRLAVLAALRDGEHLGVEAIASRARRDLGALSTQAAYDILRAFASAGLVRRLEPAGSPALYETRVGDNHHHVVCRVCGATDDVDCAVGGRPCLQPSTNRGFLIDEAEVTYWGLCPDCQARAERGVT